MRTPAFARRRASRMTDEASCKARVARLRGLALRRGRHRSSQIHEIRALQVSDPCREWNLWLPESESADLVLDVGDARRVDGPDLRERDHAALDPLEQPLAGAQDHGSDRYVDLIYQSRG